MIRSISRPSRVAALTLALLAVPVLAAPADQIRTRVAGYKQLGAAYKAVNDALRRGEPQPAVLQKSAAAIAASARSQYKWFPAGSGPQKGVRTDARREIWTNAKGFRAAQDAFARQAIAFQKIAGTGEVARIKVEARKLGATCKSCHDQFRVESD